MASTHYIALAALTIDGKIAETAKDPIDWTSKEDKAQLHRFLDQSDIVIVGHTTYRLARKTLRNRRCIVFTRSVQRSASRGPRCMYVNPNKLNLFELVKQSGYHTVAVLGGTQTFTYFLKRRALDELRITVTPIVFGKGLPLFRRRWGAAPLKFKLLSAKRLGPGGDVLLRFVKAESGIVATHGSARRL